MSKKKRGDDEFLAKLDEDIKMHEESL